MIKRQHSLDMHVSVREWIVKALSDRSSVIALPVSQRAKFEGWLKFEIAYQAKLADGVSEIQVETGATASGRKVRDDISFCVNNTKYSIELKTPNTNWQMLGVDKKTRPITKNIASIVEDGFKLMSQPNGGIVAFVLFPVREKDKSWTKYLKRISKKLSVPLSEDEHTSIVTIPLRPDASAYASLVVCVFTVHHRATY